jgi:hypothetical protein
VLLMTAACSVPEMPLGPVLSAWTSVVGHVDTLGMDTSPLVVPDTVQAGAWFETTVVTFGSRGCFRPGPTEIAQEPGFAELTPFDSARIGARRCLPGLTPAPRVVSLRFPEPGTAIVRLHGRGFRGDVIIERSVVVR